MRDHIYSLVSVNSSSDLATVVDKIISETGLESESGLVEASFHPKVCLPVNQAHLKTLPFTFTFTQLSAASVCFTEQIFLAAKLNAAAKLNVFNPSWLL